MDTTFKGWQHSPELDVSFAHCGQSAYWEGEQVFCSKCQEELTDDMFVDWLLQGGN